MNRFITRLTALKAYWTEGVILSCCVICFISVKFYYAQFAKFGLSRETGDWGLFGDYIGGVLGTILSFFSVILIYATYKNQVVVSTLQQFETTFFNLLQNQREIINSLKGKVRTDQMTFDPGEEQSSDDYISAVAKELFNHFDGRKMRHFNGLTGREIKNVSEIKDENLAIIEQYYGEVYTGKEADLGHYFRHLYHIVKYTNESKVPNKKKYVDIVQAQMSDDELYLTFYNGIAKFGRDKFHPLLDAYGFFENIRSRGKIFDLHANQFYPKTNFKYLSQL